MQVGGLLDLHQLGAQRRRSDDVAQAQAGRQHFGEGAHVHGALGRQRTNRRRRLAVVGQRAIGVVFEDQEVEFARFLRQTVTAVLGEQAAGRILEVGQAVEELGAAHRRVERLGDQTILVRSHRDELRPEQRERLQGAEVGRRLDQHPVARIDHRLGQQIKPLLRTGNDQHFVRRHRCRSRRQARRNPLPQRRKPFGGAVLQRLASARRQYMGQRSLHFIDREGRRCRQTAGKGNDFRTLGHFENLADGRTLNGARALGKKALDVRRGGLMRCFGVHDDRENSEKWRQFGGKPLV